MSRRFLWAPRLDLELTSLASSKGSRQANCGNKLEREVLTLVQRIH